MVQLWKTFCLAILEQSCVIWDSGLTKENEIDLERTQKTFCKLVLEEKYQTYEQALDNLGLESLKSRRKHLTLSFAKRSLGDGLLRDLFPKRVKPPNMKTRKSEPFKVNHANTEQYRNSPILTMQRMLNSI